DRPLSSFRARRATHRRQAASARRVLRRPLPLFRSKVDILAIFFKCGRRRWASRRNDNESAQYLRRREDRLPVHLQGGIRRHRSCGGPPPASAAGESQDLQAQEAYIASERVTADRADRTGDAGEQPIRLPAESTVIGMNRNP